MIIYYIITHELSHINICNCVIDTRIITRLSQVEAVTSAVLHMVCRERVLRAVLCVQESLSLSVFVSIPEIFSSNQFHVHMKSNNSIDNYTYNYSYNSNNHCNKGNNTGYYDNSK